MRVCDICKTAGVKYDTFAVINDKGHTEKLELCGKCYTELQHRERQHRHLAYTETVEAMTGKIPCKSSWWDVFMESIL